MLIRTLTRACGRFCFDAGDQIDLPDADALELIAAGAATQLDKPEADASVETPKSSKSKKG
jgi:hypothetical protein